jgi:short-subunit dehydrogenase
MFKRRSGKILNVASTAGFQPGPLMAVYYATKAYVISFSEALASELKGTGVTLTCLCPGPTDTNFQKRANTDSSCLFKQFAPMDEIACRLINECHDPADILSGECTSVPAEGPS